jgi:hypothetical protein
VRAASAATAANGGIGTAALQTGAVSASIIADGTITAADLSRLWRLTGNVGTAPGAHFVGTADNQALERRANSSRILRMDPTATSANLIGGSSGSGTNNSVTVPATPPVRFYRLSKP